MILCRQCSVCEKGVKAEALLCMPGIKGEVSMYCICSEMQIGIGVNISYDLLKTFHYIKEAFGILMTKILTSLKCKMWTKFPFTFKLVIFLATYFRPIKFVSVNSKAMFQISAHTPSCIMYGKLLKNDSEKK